ncbi:protein of unknown function [Candidatus Nitrosocosmicus franklandus]|uniref:Uncharacterized protein n=1 Tax=Candidatus Nitrosocosmicus franklandianus TaxID=1798806 RepID=A0A484I8P5_9ARCH|nr:protein of unknown function [Candidatus Nitrosocosmicus franklandus]
MVRQVELYGGEHTKRIQLYLFTSGHTKRTEIVLTHDSSSVEWVGIITKSGKYQY